MGKFIQQTSAFHPVHLPAAGVAVVAAVAAAGIGERSGFVVKDGVEVHSGESRSEEVLEVEPDDAVGMEDCESKVLEIVFSLCGDDSESNKGCSAADVQSYLTDQYEIHADVQMVSVCVGCLLLVMRRCSLGVRFSCTY